MGQSISNHEQRVGEVAADGGAAAGAAGAAAPPSPAALLSPFRLSSLRESLFASLSPQVTLPPHLRHSGASSSPLSFPHLTAAQLAQLRDAGVDLDLCFVPYQMPRLTDQWQDEEQKAGREKSCLRIKSGIHCRQPTLSLPQPPAPDASSSLSPAAAAAAVSAAPAPVSLTPAAAPDVTALVLSLSFDCSVACRVTLYPACSEIVDRSAAPPASRCPQPVFLSHALCSSFTQTAQPGSNQTLSVPLQSLYPAAALQQAAASQREAAAAAGTGLPSLLSFSSSRRYYPLVIHFESLQSGAAAAGQHRDEAKQPQQQQAEPRLSPAVDHLIAYFVFTRLAPASIGLKRLTLKVKVDGRSFELADIYGLPAAAAAAASAAASHESAECVICLTARRSHAIFPCRHLCLCADCADLLRHQTNRCPICRRMVEAVIPILLSSPSDREAAEQQDRGGVGGGAGQLSIAVRGG